VIGVQTSSVWGAIVGGDASSLVFGLDSAWVSKLWFKGDATSAKGASLGISDFATSSLTGFEVDAGSQSVAFAGRAAGGWQLVPTGAGRSISLERCSAEDGSDSICVVGSVSTGVPGMASGEVLAV
jgi:hypothetical protein